MLSIVLAGLAAEYDPRGPSGAAPLLESACQLLVITSPALTTATYLSVPVSVDQAEAVASEAARLAAEYDLIATVNVRGSRLHVTFERHDGARV